MENRVCLYCKKKLRPFTGYFSYDWDTRKYHKKCYEEVKVENLRNEILRISTKYSYFVKFCTN